MTLGARVLVPLDGTQSAEQALPLARLVARLAGGSIVLAHVVEPGFPLGRVLGAGVPDPRDTCALHPPEAYLDHVIACMTRDAAVADVPVLRVVLDGKPARALRHAAVAHGADLVVMASRDPSAPGQRPIGRIAERVARARGLPVVLVRGRRLGDDRPGGPGPAPIADVTTLEAPPVRHLLVPLDGSPAAEAVLAPSLALARLMNAAVTLLTADFPRDDRAAVVLSTVVLDTGRPDGADGHPTAGMHAASRREVAPYLTALACRLGTGEYRAHVRELRGLDTAEAIVRCASDVGADLIAMSTHGRGVLGRLLHGGVAHGVLRRTPFPVLMLRPTDAAGADGTR